MKDIGTITQLLGLSNDEAAVYLAALELGESSIIEIARKSVVKRPTIYNFLEKMKERGLLTETRRKKRNVFSAVSPRIVLGMAEARLKKLTAQLPELEAIENKSRTKPRVTFYEGVEGIKEVYADSLRYRNINIDGFSDFEASTKVLGDEYFRDYYIPERIKRGIVHRCILKDTPAGRRYRSGDNKHLRESRLMTGKGVSTEIHVHGNKVWLKSFRARIPFGVIIEDQDLADSLEYIWKELWDRLGPAFQH